MEDKKRQHYVSRQYLRPWCKKEQIFCMREKKIFNPNILNIAQEKYFYELQEITDDEIKFIYKTFIETSPKELQENHLKFLFSFTAPFILEKIAKNKIQKQQMNFYKKNLEEEYHSHMESNGNKYFNFLINKQTSFFNDNNEDRMGFLIFISLQYMRTKKRRNEAVRAFKDTKIDMKRLWPAISHILSTNMACSLHLNKRYKMILLENSSNINFITGDQPLINTYALNASEPLKHQELEFYYPVSPKLAILVTLKKYESEIIEISTQNEVEYYNRFIIESSEEQLFASFKKELEYIRSLYFG